jgi:hypothetical protein
LVCLGNYQVDRLKLFRLKVGVPNTSAFSLNT